MRMEYNEAMVWVCALAGLGLYTAFMAGALRRTGRRGLREWLGLLLPPLCALLLSRGGYALLQGTDIPVRFPWCYTTGLWGLMGGTWILARVTGRRPAGLLDAGAPGLGAAMALGRIGQRWLEETGAGPFLEEGSPLNRGFLVLINEWEEPVLALFEWEALGALLAALLTWLMFRKRRAPGARAAFALCALSVVQILAEQFRTGQYLQWRMVRLEQVLCALGALAGLVYLCARCRKGGMRFLPVLLFLVMAGANIAAQFILDGKLAEWPENAAWTLLTLSVAGLLGACLWAALGSGEEENPEGK